MYVLAGLLVAGFFCNLAVRPVDEQLFTLVPAHGSDSIASPIAQSAGAGGQRGLVAIAWLAVCAPLAWGVVKTLQLAVQMFRYGPGF
jgi:hypothetical protein